MNALTTEKLHNICSTYFKKIRKIYLEITSLCNLKCLHCFNGDLQYHELDVCSIVNFIRLFPHLDEVILSGGEPFLYSSLEELITCIYALPNVQMIRIITNGTIYNKTLLDFSDKLIIQISLTGSSRRLDGILRGDNTFDKSIETLYSYYNNSSSITLHISYLITRYNIDSLVADFRKLLLLPISELIYAFPSKEGRAKMIWNDLEVPIIQEIRALREIDLIRENEKKFISAHQDYLLLLNMFSIVRRDCPYVDNLKANEEIKVDYLGEIKFCNEIDFYNHCIYAASNININNISMADASFYCLNPSCSDSRCFLCLGAPK